MKVRHLLLVIMTLILVGCSNQVSNISLEKKTLIPFSSLRSDPNITSSEYLNRIEKYNIVLRSSPIPIFLTDIENMPAEVSNALANNSFSKIYGLYVINSKNESMPKEYIFINIDLPIESIVTTYFHEYKHYQCFKKGCYCVSLKDTVMENEKIILAILREKHAIEYELLEALKSKDQHLIKDVFMSISNYILYDKNPVYKMAALSVADSVEWIEAILFLANIEQGKSEKVR